MNEVSKTKTSKKFLFPVISGIVLMLIILALIIYFPEPSDKQYQVFRIILALASGSFAAVIPGFFEFRYKPFIQASGAFGVFALVYLFNPAGTEATSFDFTVFLETDRGKTVLKNEGKLILKLGNDKREEPIDGEGSVNFKNIPIANQNKTFSLQLEAEGWQFKNGETATDISLEENNTTAIVMRDNSLCCVSGSVRSEGNGFISGVRINIGGIFTETNDNGRFTLEIPPNKQEEEQKMTAHKEGYRIWESFVYPANQQDVEIVLIKE